MAHSTQRKTSIEQLLNSNTLSPFQSTGIVGLAVSKAPRESLIALYDKTLGVLNEMPRDASYRKHTEQITQQRLNIVKEKIADVLSIIVKETDINALEKKIGTGQVEEVIKQAEDELALAKKMLDWKAWEPLQTLPPEGQWEWP
ncbi:hypothetical protein QZH41_017167 [Actinostola sp. cb2023]|nr:hypothetical protein QZH41_017167 [Actinostola sp. cb2023]